MAVSAFAIGGPLGAMLGGVLANERGRRGAIMINIWIFFAGGAFMSLAQNVYQLIPARLIIGFASGLASVVVPVYLGEVAPPTLRGTLGTCTQFALVIGILMSNVLAFSLATVDRWRYLFAVTPVICLLQVAISPFLLESPKWLLSRDANSLEARVVVKQLRAYRSNSLVEEEVGHYENATNRHQEVQGQRQAKSTSAYELLHSKDMHSLVVAVLVLQLAQQLSGINAVFYYSTTFFQGSHHIKLVLYIGKRINYGIGVIADPLMGSTLTAFINVVATVDICLFNGH
jgi:SP family facilitated glucose transporter-like MFS transporter 3